MNMNELADMFSRMRERYADAEPDSYNAKFIEHDIGDMALRELEVIIKALRFAADMENLVSAGEDPVFVRGHNCIWIDGSSVAEQGDDIYAAARKAVEALEEK